LFRRHQYKPYYFKIIINIQLVKICEIPLIERIASADFALTRLTHWPSGAHNILVEIKGGAEKGPQGLLEWPAALPKDNKRARSAQKRMAIFARTKSDEGGFVSCKRSSG